MNESNDKNLSAIKTNGNQLKRLRLRRPNHSNELIIALNQTINKESFTDAILVCEQNSIRVHRIVLSLFSQYFRRTFQLIESQTNGCHYPVIAINNIPFNDLKAIVEFIYSGEVSIPKQQLDSLLKSAENLEIEGLRTNNLNNLSESVVNDKDIVDSVPRMVTLNTAHMLALNLMKKQKQKRKSNPLTDGLSKPKVADISFNKSLNNKNYSVIKIQKNELSNVNKKLKKGENNCLSLKSSKETDEHISLPMDSSLIKNNGICVNSDNNNCNKVYKPKKLIFEGLKKLYEISNEQKEERKIFLDKLICFHASNGTPIAFCPTINKQPLDLFRLYLAVKERGGYESVTRSCRWIECTHTCNVASNSNTAYALSLHYKKHLLPFESHLHQHNSLTIDKHSSVEEIWITDDPEVND